MRVKQKMESFTAQQIRDVARKLLREGKVEVVIGYERGTLPMRRRPCFVRKAEDADRLLWDGWCDNTLATYLSKRKEKTAIVAKGCDSRAVVELIKEKQVPRDGVVIIGVPCRGMFDRTKIESSGDSERWSKAEQRPEFEEALRREGLLLDCCKTCTHPNPVLHDELVGELLPEKTQDLFADIEAFNAMKPEERWAYLNGEVQKCIRCYACRNACPLCYCPECFVDAALPQWVGKSVDTSDTMIFHLMRAYHLAGRCVACGACRRACPMGVDIDKLNRGLLKHVKDLFGYEAGLSLDEKAPLATFRPDDPESFIVNP